MSAAPAEVFRRTILQDGKSAPSAPSLEDAWKRVRRLGRQFGLTVYRFEFTRTPEWFEPGDWTPPKGKRVSQFVGGRSIASTTPSNALHDLAHYQVCSPARRALPDFGLGQGPDSLVRAPLLLVERASIAEEQRASLLGILWEIELGLAYEPTMREHSWFDESVIPDVEKVMRWLRWEGLLANEHPQIQTRVSADAIGSLRVIPLNERVCWD